MVCFRGELLVSRRVIQNIHPWSVESKGTDRALPSIKSFKAESTCLEPFFSNSEMKWRKIWTPEIFKHVDAVFLLGRGTLKEDIPHPKHPKFLAPGFLHVSSFSTASVFRLLHCFELQHNCCGTAVSDASNQVVLPDIHLKHHWLLEITGR